MLVKLSSSYRKTCLEIGDGNFKGALWSLKQWLYPEKDMSAL